MLVASKSKLIGLLPFLETDGIMLARRRLCQKTWKPKQSIQSFFQMDNAQ